MECVISVDVEADNQWQMPPPSTLENVYQLGEFHSRCMRWGFPPTYLVSYEVAVDPRAVALLRPWQAAGEAEIGAHLHPWHTPPFTAGDQWKRFPSELPDDELADKTRDLTVAVARSFGVAPTSYRAGRFGFDARQVSLLSRLGYIVDSSVTPKVNWARKRPSAPGASGPDWSTASCHPFLWQGTGGDRLLEVPITILNTRFGCTESAGDNTQHCLRRNHFPNVMRTLLLGRTWFRSRPRHTPRQWDRLRVVADANRIPVLVFMIKSSELIANCSPYVRSAHEASSLFRNIESTLAFLKANGIKGVMLSDFAQRFTGSAVRSM